MLSDRCLVVRDDLQSTISIAQTVRTNMDRGGKMTAGVDLRKIRSALLPLQSRTPASLACKRTYT
jgi:hypothetical protein